MAMLPSPALDATTPPAICGVLGGVLPGKVAMSLSGKERIRLCKLEGAGNVLPFFAERCRFTHLTQFVSSHLTQFVSSWIYRSSGQA
jgi:hypothetical protein